MDSDFKWFAIMMIGVMAAMALLAFAPEAPTDFETCVAHHSVKECESVR
jgi:hypothetical protein